MNTTTTTTALTVHLEVPEPETARTIYAGAFGLDAEVSFRPAQAPTSGFRGFVISLVVSQPGTVDSLMGTALEAGFVTLKPATKSFWGYGGVVRAPDGAIWKVTTSNKKNTGPLTRDIDQVVLLLGVDNIKASKQFYLDRGLTVAKSFGSKYVEFATPDSPVGLALYGRRAAARDAGIPPEGNGSHRLVIAGDSGPFTDPDGFAWESAAR